MKPADPFDSRGRRLLRAQADRMPKLASAADDLSAPYLQARQAIIAACPDVLRAIDAPMVNVAAACLATTRELLPHGCATQAHVRLCLRLLGHLFVPMAARRRLIFGNAVRPSRSRRA